MSTIRLEQDVKKELEKLMQNELQKEISKPKALVQAIKNKYGYTHSEFVRKLIKKYKKR